MDATVERPGDVVLPARLLLDVVRSLPGPDVRLRAARPPNSDVEILSGRATFHLRTLRNDDFPHLPTAGGGTRSSLDAAPFVDTVNRVARSASRDETRPVLTGILVWAAERELRMVATDSYRLSVKTTPLEDAVTTPLEANVPARALAEVVRIVAQAEVDTIAIERSENQIIFTRRRRRPLLAPDRRAVPQLPAAAARELRPRAAGRPRGARGDRAARQPARAEERPAAARRSPRASCSCPRRRPTSARRARRCRVPFAGEPFEIGFNADFLRDGLESVDVARRS